MLFYVISMEPKTAEEGLATRTTIVSKFVPFESHSLTAAQFARIAFSGETDTAEPNTVAPLSAGYVSASSRNTLGAFVLTAIAVFSS